ncbi:hypothetical protein MKX07_000624 [Trichoderma sp. CBMAI-0711]|nr:hypothetical protein MKX07_000624 [Trichoderma sp. CBMAI-0711]
MAPSVVTIDTSDDFFAAPVATESKRTLLLAPPSLASHPSALTSVVSQYDRSITDLQMIDRLSAGLVKLPSATYELVLVLADASSSLNETLSLLTRNILGPIAESLKPKGRLQSHDGSDLAQHAALAKEAVLAGLVASNGGFDKPDYGDGEGVVSLKLGSRKKKTTEVAPAVQKMEEVKPVAPAGVGFIDFSDDLDADYDDDELIDEDTLMTEDDLKRPINIRTSNPAYPPLSHKYDYPEKTKLTYFANNSTRVPTQGRQAPPRLQRLHLRPRRAPRGRRRRQARRRRQGPAERQARRRRPDRGRLHRPGQDGLVRQLRAGRRFPVRWMSVHWAPAVQARRGGAVAEQ